MTRKRYTKLYLRHHTSTKTRKIRERMWEASSDDSLLFLELQPIFDCVLTCLVSCIINIYKKLPLFIASSLDPFREHSLFWKVITESNDTSCLRDLRSKHRKLPGIKQNMCSCPLRDAVFPSCSVSFSTVSFPNLEMIAHIWKNWKPRMLTHI